MKRRVMLFLAVGLVVALAACGGSETETAPTATVAPTTTATVAPTTSSTTQATTTTAEISGALHPIPTDSVGVTGTAACTFSSAGGITVVCELDMSDPRASGTEVSDNYWLFDDGDDDEDEEEIVVSTMWVADAVLTNGEGTWRGVTQAGDDTTPCGETHYRGEGAYEGLEFHYYFCHVDDEAQLRGWIYRSGST